MRRRLFTLAAAVSLGLCVGVLLLMGLSFGPVLSCGFAKASPDTRVHCSYGISIYRGNVELGYTIIKTVTEPPFADPPASRFLTGFWATRTPPNLWTRSTGPLDFR